MAVTSEPHFPEGWHTTAMPAVTFRIAEETDFLRFQNRLGPALSEASYCTLTDRSARDGEELLDRWPAEGDELSRHTLRELWAWASAQVLDLARERAEPCTCRLLIWGIKGLKRLRSVTIRAERDHEADPFDSFDQEELHDKDEDSVTQIERDSAGGEGRALRLCERATDLSIRGARGIVDLALRLARDSMSIHERTARVTEAQLASVNDTLADTRRQNGDFADALLGIRLEQADEAEETAKRAQKKAKKGASVEGAGIARDGLQMLKELGIAVATKQDLPEGVLELLGQSRVKELLSDPRLKRALTNPDIKNEVLNNLEAMLDALPEADAPGAADQAPDPDPDPEEDFDV